MTILCDLNPELVKWLCVRVSRARHVEALAVSLVGDRFRLAVPLLKSKDKRDKPGNAREN